MGDFKEIFESLEDSRDCSFRNQEARIRHTLSNENDITKLSIFQGLFVTPKFLSHFDFDDLSCEGAIKSRI